MTSLTFLCIRHFSLSLKYSLNELFWLHTLTRNPIFKMFAYYLYPKCELNDFYNFANGHSMKGFYIIFRFSMRVTLRMSFSIERFFDTHSGKSTWVNWKSFAPFKNLKLIWKQSSSSFLDIARQIFFFRKQSLQSKRRSCRGPPKCFFFGKRAINR